MDTLTHTKQQYLRAKQPTFQKLILGLYSGVQICHTFLIYNEFLGFMNIFQFPRNLLPRSQTHCRYQGRIEN